MTNSVSRVEGSATRLLATLRAALESLQRSLARPIDRKVLAALLSPLLVLVVAVLAFEGIQGVRESQDWLGHSRDVIDALQRIQLAVVDAETEQRAYLLTEEPRSFESYQAAATRVRALLEMLTDLVADNAQQALRAKGVRLVAEAKLEHLRTTLQAFETEGVDTARDAVRNGQGRQDMEAVRTVTLEMIEAERDLAILRTKTRNQQVTYTTWVIAAGSVIAVVLALVVNVGIRRDVTVQRRNQALLEDQAARLEAQRNSLEESERKLAEQLKAERTLSDRLAAASAAAEIALAERNAANAALERSNRELNQFAYVASHDLKAPLRGIANLAQWVEEDLGVAMTDGSREHIRVLLSRVRRMEGLIDGILAYARAGKGTGQREEIDVGQLVREVLELLSPMGAVQVELAQDLPRLQAEKAPFQQIWMNLLGNAIKHGRREGASVRICAQDRGAEWEFLVTDNGPGIAPQYQQRIFGIFQTLASRDRMESTGIGLATVKKLVETEGGRVWVESQVGEGATFGFTWPKQQERS